MTFSHFGLGMWNHQCLGMETHRSLKHFHVSQAVYLFRVVRFQRVFCCSSFCSLPIFTSGYVYIKYIYICVAKLTTSQLVTCCYHFNSHVFPDLSPNTALCHHTNLHLDSVRLVVRSAAFQSYLASPKKNKTQLKIRPTNSNQNLEIPNQPFWALWRFAKNNSFETTPLQLTTLWQLWHWKQSSQPPLLYFLAHGFHRSL